MSDLITTINESFQKDKKVILPEIESEYHMYLQQNNKDFLSKPKLRDIEHLFHLYDKKFFNNQLSNNLSISLRTSNKLTRSAGMVNFSKRKQEARISLSLTLIFQSYLKQPEGYLVNGIFCKTPLTALMRVLEHEIVHLLEYILNGSSNCSNPQFLKMAYELFGHTESKHMLGIELQNYVDLKTLKVGDMVSFPYHGKIHKGSIINIKKNVTIAVDGLYNSRKYYVPLDVIIKDESDEN